LDGQHQHWNSVLFQNGGFVCVGTTTPGLNLDVAGNINFSGALNYQHQPFLSSPGAGMLCNTAVGYSFSLLTL
jgi:hypothetical protein